MQTVFDQLIDCYIADKVGISDHFLDEVLAFHLHDNLQRLYQTSSMEAAGTGSRNALNHNMLVRSDKIYWLDRKHDDPFEDAFLDMIDSFVEHLNRTCYTGIKSYEFHYALFEKGSLYSRHLDRFRDDDSRLFSMISYLNPAWVSGDGGELCIYHADETRQVIAPSLGKSVFFKSSELEHEVLMANTARLSITGWLKK